LGCVLYQLVTRRQPFSGVSLTAVLTALAVDVPVPPESLNRQIPLPLAELIKQLLAKDPAARPDSATEVAQRLWTIEQSLVDADALSVQSGTPDWQQPSPVPRLSRRWIWLIAPAAILALAVGAWVAWAKWGAAFRLDGGKSTPAHSGTADVRHIPKGKGDDAVALKTPPSPGFPSLDGEWVKTTMASSPNEQVNAVMKELDRRNPGFLGSGNIEAGFQNAPNTTDPIAVIGLKVPADKLVDLSPLRVLTQLENLNCAGSAKGRSRLKNLTPLTQLTLRELHLSNTSVADLTPLTSMPLEFLDLRNTPVADLMPLKDQTRLKSLYLSDTSASDLKPLARLPLNVLHVRNIPAQDLSPLAHLPLDELELDFNPQQHRDLLDSLQLLRVVNGESRDTFLKAAAQQK
jgi:serine/threonine protein kinase